MEVEHEIGFDERDSWALFHSCAFGFSVWEMWGALLHGGRLVIVPARTSRSPQELYKLTVKENVTILSQTPSAFRQYILAEETVKQDPNLNLRYVILGGESLEMNSLRPWFERHGDDMPQVANIYGITETTVNATVKIIKQDVLHVPV